MKVLLMGDASNYHRCLATGLARLGHNVTVASNGSGWMETARDIDLSRKPAGKIGGDILWARINTVLASRLKGYDIVHIASNGFVSLKPQRMLTIFDRLRHDNGKIFLSALGTDSIFVRACTKKDPPLRYSEWQLPSGPTEWSARPEAARDIWLSDELYRLSDHLYTHIDGIVSALYEYDTVCRHMYPDVPVAYGGIPIDLNALPRRTGGSDDDKRALLLTYAAHRGREGEKGADILLRAAREVAARHPQKVILSCPDNVPYTQFIEILRHSDIVTDQLYSFTPATTALLAMALGAVPVSGAEPEFYDFIGEKELRPIINPDPCDFEKTCSRLERIVTDRELFISIQAQGREFVQRHNDIDTVARRFENFWLSL